MKHGLNYMIAVMQAAKEGYEIEVKIGEDGQWEKCDVPCWDWDGEDYRIKLEKTQYVPYENAEEFLQAQKEHGPYLKSEGMYYYPLNVDNEGIAVINIDNKHEIYLFNDKENRMLSLQFVFTWQDGTRCCNKIELWKN